ncbi:hypothetical protein [Martelella alba]|uniref:hypothetical protein n=1 Tax=Martelella alba TaxID=2590451 RepID=UPI002E25B9C3
MDYVHLIPTFAIVIGAIFLFALDRFPTEGVALGVLGALLVIFCLFPGSGSSGADLTVGELFAGVSSPALVTILALLVVGNGLLQPMHWRGLPAESAGPTAASRLSGATGAAGAISLLSHHRRPVDHRPVEQRRHCPFHDDCAGPGHPPLAFASAVIFAANCSFATPIAYQTNMLVMGPGHYSFSDFVKAGLPLTIILTLFFALLAPWHYHL